MVRPTTHLSWTMTRSTRASTPAASPWWHAFMGSCKCSACSCWEILPARWRARGALRRSCGRPDATSSRCTTACSSPSPSRPCILRQARASRWNGARRWKPTSRHSHASPSTARRASRTSMRSSPRKRLASMVAAWRRCDSMNMRSRQRPRTDSSRIARWAASSWPLSASPRDSRRRPKLTCARRDVVTCSGGRTEK